MLATMVLAQTPKAFAASAADRLPQPGQGAEPVGAQGKHDSHQELVQLQQLTEKAVAFEDNGDYRQAAQLWEKILGIVQKALGPEHTTTAATLTQLAELYKSLDRHGDAELLIKRALSIYEKALGPEHTSTAAVLNQLAELYKGLGRYGDAKPLFKRALAICEKAKIPEELMTARILNNLAGLSQDQARYGEAEVILRRALAIYEKVRGPEDRMTAVILGNMASLYQDQGRYGESELFYRRALAINEKTQGAESPSIATVLNNLADLYRGQGRYGDAETLLKRALAIREKTLGFDHSGTASIVNNLAHLYKRLGRLEEAESLFKRALVIYKKTFAEGSPHVANVLNNMALLYEDDGRYREAEELLERAVAISSKTLGMDHPRTATRLCNLAGLYLKQDRLREAELLYGRSLAIYEKALGAGGPDAALCINDLAVLYQSRGLYKEATVLLEKSLAHQDKVLGINHPDATLVLNNVARVYLLQGRSVAAWPLANRLSTAQSDWLRRELPLQPRELRRSQLQAQPDVISTTFALLHQDSSTAPQALETRLNHQGLLAEIEQRQQQLATSSPSTRDLAERIAGLDRQLASVSLPSERRPVLRQERQQLEAELFRALPNLRLEAVTVPQVAAALKVLAPDGVLVEFQKYRPFLRDAGKGKPGWGSSRYVALLLRSDGRVSSVQLGEARPIDAAIAQALQASADNNGDALELWGGIGNLLFKPLQSQLGGVRQLFLSPDSELNRVPFAAVPVPGQSKQLLGEVLQLRVLTTGRDLLRLQQSLPASGPAALIANPDYDRKDGVPATTDAANSIASLDTPTSSGSRSQQRSSDLDGSKPWKPLPATAQEAKLLAPLLQVTQPISGSQATVTRTLQLKAPRILHIATHGFFEADQQAAAKDAGPFRSLADRQDPGAVRQEDPLLRSGLVLAGANHPQADPKDDGYLTAAEATGLQLEGTELVTLSACETGLGALRSGEGVYGLQRALTVAGARSTLLSLWKVNDDATAEFMVRFYKRLKTGEGRAEALAATQKEFRDGIPGHPDWMQPYYWAAWQLVGDWRPMARP